jgi:GT2 family glycosyltransferase
MGRRRGDSPGIWIRLRHRGQILIAAVRAASRLPIRKSALARRVVDVWLGEGPGGIKRRVLRLADLTPQPSASALERNRLALLSRFNLDAETRARISAEIDTFSALPLISVLVPVYNPIPSHLRRMIASVTAQLYPRWELCVADDASSSEDVRSILEDACRDHRIKVTHRPATGGISAASNSALAMCSGAYVALLDHDDELTPDALFWTVKAALAHPTAGVLYSDEDKLSSAGVHVTPFVKPDWSPELMYNGMYIGHLTVYKKPLMDQVGGFRSAFDLAQDYDLALRITEVARDVRHIPRILYHWRQASGSAAAGKKPHAREANLAALQSALDRRQLRADAIALPTANWVRFKRDALPSVTIVIPTDSEVQLIHCLNAVAAHTPYPSLEIVVVTNSKLADKLSAHAHPHPLSLCRFDAPFNFSAKCNAGAKRASGEVLLFLNDDVRPLAAGWLESTIELLANPDVGAVSPKLVYENLTIQYAGMVTGVRGLVGTPFHCLPADTATYFNFAQSVRDVSVVSGACLAIRRADFFEVGAFDETHAPTAHSDVDLSFRIREKGWRCVYTPHAMLLHIGHLSLRVAAQHSIQGAKDKADLYLLKRWGEYITYDPYFPDDMRDLLYHDSPESIRMTGRNQPDWVERAPDVLVVTHDLSSSGAPMAAYWSVKQLLAAGAFPVVTSPVDGPLRSMYEDLGVPVIIDSLLLSQHESVARLARNFDCVVVNTILAWPVVRQLQSQDPAVPVLWYLHETGHIRKLVSADPSIGETVRSAKHVVVSSARTQAVCALFDAQTTVLTPGMPDPARTSVPRVRHGPLVFSVFGSVEPRKGQDVFVAASTLLAERAPGGVAFNVVGRHLDPTWTRGVQAMAAGLDTIRFHGDLPHRRCLDVMEASDVVVCPSRDDALALVVVEGMGLSKVVICSNAAGASDFITHGVDGFVVPADDVDRLADSMWQIVAEPALAQQLGAAARQTFLRHFSEDAFGPRLNRIVRSMCGLDA